MKILLNAGFDWGLANDLPQIAELDYAGVRRDVKIENVDEFAAEFVPYSNMYLDAIVQTAGTAPAQQLANESKVIAESLVRNGLEHRCGIEICNETDLTKQWGGAKNSREKLRNAGRFGDAVNLCYDAIRSVSPHIDVISGGVSDASDQHVYLKAMLNGLNHDVVVAYHIYRWERGPDTPQEGFRTRAAEQQDLMAILGTFRRMCNETGNQTGDWAIQARWWPLPPRQRQSGHVTYEQAAEYFRRECLLAQSAGCEFIGLYQQNDSPNNPNDFGHRFLATNEPKPIAQIAKLFVEETPPNPNHPLVMFRVLDEAGNGISGAKVTITLDLDPVPVVIFTDATGTCAYTATLPGTGAWLDFSRDGYEPISRARRLIPSVSTAGPLEEWPATVTMFTVRPLVSLTVVDRPVVKGVPPSVVSGVSVTFKPDLDVPVTVITNDHGRVTYRATKPGTGMYVHYEKSGYITPPDERRLIPSFSTDGPESEWPSTFVLQRTVKPLPPIPTREQVCSIKMHLQGLTYHTRLYGAMPGVFFWSAYEDRATSVFPAHRAVGDTHLPVGISGSYNEPNTVWPPVITKGGDFSKNLPAFKAQLREVICEGFFCDVPLSGDGQSVGDATGYNDPVGSTYGYQWLMNNLPRILKAVRGDADSECPDGEDLTPYCVFRPGWDGCFTILLAILSFLWLSV